jgi:hypothetical protein
VKSNLLFLAIIIISSLASMEFFNLYSGVIVRIIEGNLTDYDVSALKISPFIFPLCILGFYLYYDAHKVFKFIQRKNHE